MWRLTPSQAANACCWHSFINILNYCARFCLSTCGFPIRNFKARCWVVIFELVLHSCVCIRFCVCQTQCGPFMRRHHGSETAGRYCLEAKWPPLAADLPLAHRHQVPSSEGDMALGLQRLCRGWRLRSLRQTSLLSDTICQICLHTARAKPGAQGCTRWAQVYDHDTVAARTSNAGPIP